MAMRGRFSGSTTSDGSDYAHRQTVASYYRASAAARSRLRLLFAADATLAVPVVTLTARSLSLRPDDYLLPVVLVLVTVLIQALTWFASFKTRSWRFVCVMALASIGSGAILGYAAYQHDQMVSRTSYLLLGLVHAAVGLISLQLASAFSSASRTSSSSK